MGHRHNAEIAEQNLMLLAHQHVPWLDIAVDELALVGILQGTSDLLDIGDDQGQGNSGARRMFLAERLVGCVIEHQEGSAILKIEIEHSHNMGMRQFSDHLCLTLEGVDSFSGQMSM